MKTIVHTFRTKTHSDPFGQFLRKNPAEIREATQIFRAEREKSLTYETNKTIMSIILLEFGGTKVEIYELARVHHRLHFARWVCTIKTTSVYTMLTRICICRGFLSFPVQYFCLCWIVCEHIALFVFNRITFIILIKQPTAISAASRDNLQIYNFIYVFHVPNRLTRH